MGASGASRSRAPKRPRPPPSRRPMFEMQIKRRAKKRRGAKRAGTSLCTCLYTQNIHKQAGHIMGEVPLAVTSWEKCHLRRPPFRASGARTGSSARTESPARPPAFRRRPRPPGLGKCGCCQPPMAVTDTRRAPMAMVLCWLRLVAGPAPSPTCAHDGSVASGHGHPARDLQGSEDVDAGVPVGRAGHRS